jgi:hypothetical protein
MTVHDIIKETFSGSIATSMGNGNGFVNGGPGTKSRKGKTKKKTKETASNMIKRVYNEAE